MAKSYPRIGEVRKWWMKKGRKLCPVCQTPKVFGRDYGLRIDVQVDIFRGNDLVFYICPECSHTLKSTGNKNSNVLLAIANDRFDKTLW